MLTHSIDIDHAVDIDTRVVHTHRYRGRVQIRYRCPGTLIDIHKKHTQYHEMPGINERFVLCDLFEVFYH